MATSMHDDYLKVLGPGTGLAKVFAFFERDGYSDPSAAWDAFTGTWNWAAPLATAALAADHAQTAAIRQVTGGFVLSGLWHLPSHAGTGSWLALPFAAGERQAGRTAVSRGGPDLFVVPSTLLPGVMGGPADDVSGPVLRLEGVHVPTGFATHSAGTPLLAGDGPFFWAAAAALALGAARRMVDALAAPTASGATHGPVPTAAVAAELAAALHDERCSLAAAVHDAPSARQGLPSSATEQLTSLVRQAGNVVHHVVAAAYEQAMAWGGGDAERTLVELIETSTPILQQARYATGLLPPDDRILIRKAEHVDDGRISG
ncbi:hypothetical protein ACIQB5_49230 [Streptomyces sp. NPDC088560]|uniref:hypothetical protein n=1 Tax=Streptomyces sp. NPDC088560 TaxID=3365868 RepID=UPI003823690D